MFLNEVLDRLFDGDFWWQSRLRCRGWNGSRHLNIPAFPLGNRSLGFVPGDESCRAAPEFTVESSRSKNRAGAALPALLPFFEFARFEIGRTMSLALLA